jgi:cytoskeletal protein CcmA (bactofilin family)
MSRETTGLRELSALIGEHAEFEGKLLFEGRVRIDGRFRGEIESEDALVLGPASEVEADIRVGTLIMLGGTLRGEVKASRSVELHAPSKVYGSITAPQLMIDRGVLFEGQSRIPDAPAGGPASGRPRRPLGDAVEVLREGTGPDATGTPDDAEAGRAALVARAPAEARAPEGPEGPARASAPPEGRDS